MEIIKGCKKAWAYVEKFEDKYKILEKLKKVSLNSWFMFIFYILILFYFILFMLNNNNNWYLFFLTLSLGIVFIFNLNLSWSYRAYGLVILIVDIALFISIKFGAGNFSLGFIFLAILFSLFVYSKIHPLIGLLFSAICSYMSFLLLKPLSSDVISALFSVSKVSSGNLFLWGVIIILILFSWYFLLTFVFQTIIKIFRNRFEYLNNKYFKISLILILIILFVGFYLIKDSYHDDYPFSVHVANGSINIFDCHDTTRVAYFVHNHWVTCSLSEKNDSIPYLNFYPSLYIIKDGNNWSFLHSNQYKIEKTEDGKEFISFMLDTESRGYQFLFYSNTNMSENDGIRSDIFLGSSEIISSEKEYQHRIFYRNTLIGTIFSVALFSVFSAMANLKKILEGTS